MQIAGAKYNDGYQMWNAVYYTYTPNHRKRFDFVSVIF